MIYRKAPGPACFQVGPEALFYDLVLQGRCSAEKNGAGQSDTAFRFRDAPEKGLDALPTEAVFRCVGDVVRL